MIDVISEIFDTLAKGVREKHSDVSVTGEYTRSPSKFPAVTLDETENVTVDRLVDSSDAEKFAGVRYRLQVFSNKQAGRKAEARAIFSTADELLLRMGLRRKTYTTTPDYYNSTIYSIEATYEGIISAEGIMYAR